MNNIDARTRGGREGGSRGGSRGVAGARSRELARGHVRDVTVKLAET